MPKEIWILGVQIPERSNIVSEVQRTLTKFGCTIKTRLGLHEVSGGSGSPGGLILLELTGDPEEYRKLENALLNIEGLQVRKMVFSA